MIVKLPTDYYNKMRKLRRQLASAELQLQKSRSDLEKLKKTKTGKGKGIGKKSVPKTNVCQTDDPGFQPAAQEDIQPNAQAGVRPVAEPVVRPLPEPIPDQHIEINEATPRKSASDVMERSNLSPEEFPEIHKHITGYQTLIKQIKTAPKSVKRAILEKPSKSRVASRVAKDLGLNRRGVFRKRRQNIEKRQQLNREKIKITRFLKKQPNSNPLPGKKDVTAKGQKYALNDTLANLYKKYKLENPQSKVSLATFCRQRPSTMKTIQWADRRQCLCQYHQNGKLKLQAIKQHVSISTFLDQNTPDDISELLSKLPDRPVKFTEWQKDEVLFEGRIMKKLKIKQLELSKEEFCERFEDEFSDLREHVDIMRNQFQEFERLKNKLKPLTEITCNVDYSENYPCVYQEEPAQAFFDRSMVTIHPMVINYRDADNKLQHKSFVGISPEKAHNAPTTFAFLKKLVPLVREILPDLERIHYISDSPTSQYRNRSIAKVIANHLQYFPGISGTWDYLQVGHGKSACDGVGGSIKKSADIAVKRNTIIANAQDFFQWAVENNDVMQCVYVSPGDVSLTSRMLQNADAVPGLSKCHSIRPYHGYLHIRSKSCYNDCCDSNPQCPGWEKTPIKVFQYTYPVEPEESAQQSETCSNIDESEENVPMYEIGCIVEVSYKGKVYRGRIEAYDDQEKVYDVKFMKRNRSGQYIWPKTTWSLPVSGHEIDKVIE